MSRLIDRLREAGGARMALSLDLVADDGRGPHHAFAAALRRSAELEPRLRSLMVSEGVRWDDDLSVTSWQTSREKLRARKGLRLLGGSELDGLQVFAGDWVPEWVSGMDSDQSVREFAAPVFPPFDKFWIEVQPRSAQYRNLQRYYAWGARFEQVDPNVFRRRLTRYAGELGASLAEPLDLDDAFCFVAEPVIEPTKGDPVGPLGQYWFAADQNGTIKVLLDSELMAMTYLIDSPTAAPIEMRSLHIDTLMVPLIATLGFLSVKRGMEQVEHQPTRRKSKKGRVAVDPTPYREVRISHEFKAAIDEHMRATGASLGEALRTVRGHTATYTPDKPLFGRRDDERFVGTFFRPGRVGAVPNRYTVDEPEPPVGSAEPCSPPPPGPGGVGR